MGSNAPYLYDDRAPILTAADSTRGGEAKTSRDMFAAMSAANQQNLVLLKTP
ncbi:MAG: hypothetical protein ACYDBW_01135 [Sulfuricaulis sp.]